MTTFAYNSSSNGATAVTATQRSLTLQFTDENGATVLGSTLSLSNYWINSSILSSGTGSADTLIGTSGNDLVLWDDLIETSLSDPFGGNRHGVQNSSATAAIESFNLGDGNDVFAFNYSALTLGTAYTYAVTVDAGNGNDVIWSAAGADLLVGGYGVDSVYGGVGNDVIFGDLASDPNSTVAGGATSNADVLYGGSGNDIIYGDDYGDIGGEAGGGNDRLFGGSGRDTLYGGGDNDTLQGGDGNDAVYGGIGSDVLYGDAGDDVLSGGLGDDVINGGGGLDTISYADATAAVIVDATAGNEVNPRAAVSGGAGVDDLSDYFAIEGSNYADTMTGGNNYDVFFGGLGDDTLTGGAQGADTVYGGDGNDLLSGMYLDHGGGLEDTLYGGNGDDVMIFSSAGTSKNPPNPDYAWTGESTSSLLVLDTQSLDDTSDYFYGGAGNDTLDASRDTTYTKGVYVHAGKDPAVDWIMSVEYIIATNNDDVVNLTYSDATGTSRAASSDSVTVDALGGNDIIASGAGNDSLYGNNGTDTIYGGDGNDQLFGGDRFGFDDGGDDRLFGGDGDDVITDTRDAPLVMGGAGHDTITVTEWLNSTIYGGDGNDLFDITYNATSSTLYGGIGDDTAIVGGSYGSTTVDMGDGNDYLVELGSGGSQVDTVWGGNGDDIISIFAGNDTAWGGGGVDVIWSGAGTDTIYGGDGNDHLYGGEFGNTSDHNYIYGGIGEDSVYVSRDDGTDHYYGGGDGRNDEIVMFGRFALTSETPVGGWFSANTGVSENNGGTVNIGQRLGSDSDSDITISYNAGVATMINKQTGATIIFNTADVAAITLWNSDANFGAGQHFEEVFEWNATQNAYTFDHWA